MNDVDLVERLWREYQIKIAKYIGKQKLHRWGSDVVDDLVASVFMRASVAINNGNGPKEHEAGWLYQIARSVMIDHLRLLEHKTFVSFDDCWMEPSHELSPYECAEREIARQQVHAAISQLAGYQADVVNLRLDGHRHAVIAEMLGKEVEAVKQANSRAFGHLREWLKDLV